MAVDFSALDREVDQEQLRKDVEEAKNNSGDIPKGTYIVGIDKMEIRATKDGRPMFFIQCRVKEGEYKNKCVFMNPPEQPEQNTRQRRSREIQPTGEAPTETPPQEAAAGETAGRSRRTRRTR